MPGFADPLFLLLLAVPLLARLLPEAGREGGAALLVPEGIGALLGRGAARAGRALWRTALPLLLWASLITALAGPRLLVPNPALPVSGRDLVIALDLSGSMVREDFLIDGREVSRLAALKHVATRFVLGRGGDRVTLVIFGSRAYVASPPSFDVQAVATAIETAEIGISGRATGISGALGLALKRLGQSEAASRVVILLSDGVHNSGPVEPRDAARLASEQGVRVHTIAMGPRDLTNPGGERDAVDAATLRAIAERSGGTAFRVRTTDDLLAVAEEIDRLEAISGDGPAALVHRSLWLYPALLALGLAGLMVWRAQRA
ncbi:MAG: VWA domain-containing protein [Pseudomonadota bacterium]